MSDVEKIDVFAIVGHGVCVAGEDGEMVYHAICDALQRGCKVVVSFSKVTDVTSVFLNAAIGQLYGAEDFCAEDLRARLSVVDMPDQDILTLKRTVDRAKEYYKDPERFHAAALEVLGHAGN